MDTTANELPVSFTCSFELHLPRDIDSFQRLKDLMDISVNMCGDIDYDDEVEPDYYD